MLDKNQVTYLSVSITCILISIIHLFYIAKTIVKDKKLIKHIRGNAILVSWCFLLFPGLVLVVVFLFEDIIQIYQNEIIQEGSLCNFFSFIAIWTVVSSNGSTCTISYLTYMMFCKRGKRGDFKTVFIGNACSWILGLVISIIYLIGGKFGPFRGLYCCVKEELYDGIIVAEVFLVFGIAVAVQVFMYSSCCLEALNIGELQNTSAAKTSIAIMKRGLEMIGVFYLSYVLIVVDSIAIFSKKEPNILLGMFAAWMPKLELSLHCILLHQSIKRIQKKSNATVVPLGSHAKNSGSNSHLQLTSLHSFVRAFRIPSRMVRSRMVKYATSISVRHKDTSKSAVEQADYGKIPNNPSGISKMRSFK